MLPARSLQGRAAVPLSGVLQAVKADAGALGVRAMGSIPYPAIPYTRRKMQLRRQFPITKWASFNDPKLVPKFLRFAERRARELGVTADVQAFDEAAAAFPKPCPVIVSVVLERPHLITRDVEDWEADFATHAWNERQRTAKQYPQQLLDMFNAANTVMEGAAAGAEGGADGGAKKGAPEGGAKKEGGKEGAAAAGAGGEAAAAAAPAAGGATRSTSRKGGAEAADLSSFYSSGGAVNSDGMEKKAELVLAPRESSADEIGDFRSLDRAYTQRLALILKDKATGAWDFPRGERLPDEPMARAVERILHAAFSHHPHFLPWVMSNAPIGHMLNVYPPEKQKASGCYGEKVFFYRAEIHTGRFRLPTAGPWSDFAWVTRDESERYFERGFYKYVHQIMGAGAGEEYSRRQAWLKKIEAKGLSVAQATGRRAHRVRAESVAGLRMAATATRAQISLASMKYEGGAKREAQVKEAADAFKRRMDTKKLSEQLRAQLAIPSAAALHTAWYNKTFGKAGSGGAGAAAAAQ